MRPLNFALMTWLVLAVNSDVRADLESGPEKGAKVEALPVFVATGEFKGQTKNLVKHRDGKATLWFFVPADKWNRPTARLLRALDDKFSDVEEDGEIIAVWMSDDLPKAKEYMPVADRALKLDHTTFTVYEKDPLGPADWAIHPDADVTVVATRGGKVVQSFGFVSANETLAKSVLKALMKK
ncbi:hypothetical protein [Thalassoroseus pseudoceratinae]|uniref:hypothetical protein n=1 Tax=Thalassoroseus pseudoceratinae TaxID=2713176 RepID=UPI001422F89F|nr:hypothetical protein [Thalassoroseus pseudoceratinae]